MGRDGRGRGCGRGRGLGGIAHGANGTRHSTATQSTSRVDPQPLFRIKRSSYRILRLIFLNMDGCIYIEIDKILQNPPNNVHQDIDRAR